MSRQLTSFSAHFNMALVVRPSTTATIRSTSSIANLIHSVIHNINNIWRVAINYLFNRKSAISMIAVCYLTSLEVMLAKMTAFDTRLTTTWLNIIVLFYSVLGDYAWEFAVYQQILNSLCPLYEAKMLSGFITLVKSSSNDRMCLCLPITWPMLGIAGVKFTRKWENLLCAIIGHVIVWLISNSEITFPGF